MIKHGPSADDEGQNGKVTVDIGAQEGCLSRRGPRVIESNAGCQGSHGGRLFGGKDVLYQNLCRLLPETLTLIPAYKTEQRSGHEVMKTPPMKNQLPQKFVTLFHEFHAGDARVPDLDAEKIR